MEWATGEPIRRVPADVFRFLGRAGRRSQPRALWGAASEEDVDELLEHLGDLDTMVVVSEASADRLGPKLKEAGLVFGGACPLMTVGLTPAAPDEGPYRIEAVREQEQLGVMVDVLADAYALALEHTSASFGTAILTERDTTPFLAWREEVAWSAVIATRVGTDIGIWAMGTPPRFQRQGAGRALLGSVMSRFAPEGAQRCFLFPSPAPGPLKLQRCRMIGSPPIGATRGGTRTGQVPFGIPRPSRAWPPPVDGLRRFRGAAGCRIIDLTARRTRGGRMLSRRELMRRSIFAAIFAATLLAGPIAPSLAATGQSSFQMTCNGSVVTLTIASGHWSTAYVTEWDARFIPKATYFSVSDPVTGAIVYEEYDAKNSVSPDPEVACSQVYAEDGMVVTFEVYGKTH